MPAPGRAGERQGDDLRDLVQVDARLFPGAAQEACPLGEGGLAGRLVRLAVTGTGGAELAEHDRLECCPVLGRAHHRTGSRHGETMGDELDACGGEDLEAPGAEPVPERELHSAHPGVDRVAVAPEGHARLVVDEPRHLDRGRVGNRRQCHQHLGVGELTNGSPSRPFPFGELTGVDVTPRRPQPVVARGRPEPVQAQLGLRRCRGRHRAPPAPAAELHAALDGTFGIHRQLLVRAAISNGSA